MDNRYSRRISVQEVLKKSVISDITFISLDGMYTFMVTLDTSYRAVLRTVLSVRYEPLDLIYQCFYAVWTHCLLHLQLKSPFTAFLIHCFLS
jgi:hypothetical protein